MCKSSQYEVCYALQSYFHTKVIKGHFWVWMKTVLYKQNKLPLSLIAELKKNQHNKQNPLYLIEYIVILYNLELLK